MAKAAAGKTAIDTAAPAEAPATVTVRALRLGYAGDRRRRPGDVFRAVARSVTSSTGILASWLERVPDGTPERAMAPADYARQQQAQLTVPRINPIGHTIERDDDEDRPSNKSTGDRDVI